MPTTHRHSTWFMTTAVASAALLVILLPLVATFATAIESDLPCNAAQYPAECEALVAIYFYTGGARWLNKYGWLDYGDVCKWHGVTCDDKGRVLRISMNGNNLSGSLPPDIEKFTRLQELWLPNNALVSVPPQIGNLINLQWLNLSYTPLTSLPPEMGHLDALRMLWADSTPLTCVPASVAHLVRNIPACEE